MLTKKQNLLETIQKGGKPDRFVKQYEFMNLVMEAGIIFGNLPMFPGQMGKDGWGVTWNWPEGQMGGFPMHDAEHKVLKDITEWKKVVKKPVIPTSDEAWAPAVAHANAINRDEEFVGIFFAPGVFEETHHLMGMEDAMTALYEEPEALHELIGYITDFELEYAAEVTKRIRPDAILHHDDWGSYTSSFMAPDMFEEFFLPAYKKIYGFYKQNGVELIVHHSDSYAANLVPHMIEMGMDIWQGVVPTNNVPELIEKYGGQLSFMGEVETKLLDVPDWTPELVKNEVERACRKCGKFAFIPCLTSGLPMSSFPGVYDEVNKQIDRMSSILF